MPEKPAVAVFSGEHVAASRPEVRQLMEQRFHTYEEGFRGRMRIQ